MSDITVGKIITGAEDVRRDLLWESLRPLRANGYERGRYAVELEPGFSLDIRIGASEHALSLQFDELLERLVEQNREVALEMTGTEDLEELLSIAWFALNPVRIVGYGDGDYSVKIPGGFVLRYSVTKFEALLLHRFDDLLLKLDRENREVLDRLLSTTEGSELAA